MAFCHQCGAKGDDGSKFCGECGTPLAASGQGSITTSNTQVLGDHPGPRASEALSSPDTNTAMIMVLICLFAGFISPLIFWLINKDLPEKAWLTEQSRAMLNFQLTVLIGLFLSGILYVVFIGIITMILIGLANLIICILAAIAVSRGETYRYPLSLQLIR